MKVARTVAEARAHPRAGTVGLVPTMGALHDGHLALVAAARAECDTVVASVFVNPAQFDDADDLAAYPRDEAADLAALAAAGVDLAFVPPVDEIYPPGFRTWVDPGEEGLEAAQRPGHFRGVATVCVKLFAIAGCDRAYFGAKDAQQVGVVERVVRDLALLVELRVVATVRDEDGLALSSRNARLSADERRRALAIPRALATRDATAARAVLVEAGIEPEYVEVADLAGPRLLVAARVGATRLIDNVPLDGGAA